MDSTEAPDRVARTIRLSPDAVKVLAHPLRSRLLSALRVDGPATATTLATRLATNTGATSYHLRKLAAVGLVEEADGGRGRERWWRPTSEMHTYDDQVGETDPDARAAVGWLREHYVRRFVAHADQWLADHESWPLEWRRFAGSSDYALELTAEELEALLADLWAVLDRAQAAYGADRHRVADDAPGADAPADDDRRRVVIFVHHFPEEVPPR